MIPRPRPLHHPRGLVYMQRREGLDVQRIQDSGLNEGLNEVVVPEE